jgi:hypothetical protein
MIQKIKNVLTGSQSIPLAILLLCVVSFGLVAFEVGHYWDDWFYAYFFHFFDPSEYWEAFQEDRPLASWIFSITTHLVGDGTARWQIFALFARWVTGLSFWGLLSVLWPGRTRSNAIAALLFVVYPGFRQQHIAILYSNWLLILGLFILSLGLMLWSVRKGGKFSKYGIHWPLLMISVLLSGYSMGAVEYFFGLELLRPLLLWIVLSEAIPDWRPKIKRLGMAWSPYLVVMGIFLFWRMTNKSARGTITFFDNLRTAPFESLINLVRQIISDTYEVSVLAWGKVINFQLMSGYGSGPMVGVSLVIIITAIFAIFYLSHLQNVQMEKSHRVTKASNWSLQAIALGVVAIFLGGIPFWMTSLQVTLQFPRDRFTMSMMIGVALLTAGIIEAAGNIEKFSVFSRGFLAKIPIQAVLAGIVLGLAAGMHFQVGLSYRKEWVDQKDFFWQLTWRIPGLQPGTALLITDVPFPYDSDNALFAPVNWIYGSDPSQRELPHYYYNIESHLSRGLPALTADTPIRIRYRFLNFRGGVSKAVFVIYRPPACLKLVDPYLDQHLPSKPRFFREGLPFSDPSLVIADASPPARPPEIIFGDEPEHGWCYDYQKADLARYLGDWQHVVSIGDLSLEGKVFNRTNVSEMIPFIQGYANVGRWDRAAQLSIQAFRIWDNMKLMLCKVWSDLALETPATLDRQSALDEIEKTMACHLQK